jgi:uncharacterized membrane-anchored protein
MTGTSFIPIIVAVIVVIRFHRFISRFKDSGTTTPKTAKTLEELNLKRRLIFNRLLYRRVLIEISSERYYLNEENLIEYYKARRIRMIVISGILILIILIDALVMNY